jgi:hypothetical protein
MFFGTLSALTVSRTESRSRSTAMSTHPSGVQAGEGPGAEPSPLANRTRTAAHSRSGAQRADSMAARGSAIVTPVTWPVPTHVSHTYVGSTWASAAAGSASSAACQAYPSSQTRAWMGIVTEAVGLAVFAPGPGNVSEQAQQVTLIPVAIMIRAYGFTQVPSQQATSTNIRARERAVSLAPGHTLHTTRYACRRPRAFLDLMAKQI